MNRRFMRVWGLAFLAITAFAAGASADWNSPQVQVYCYAGDRSNNQYLGTVDVYDERKAAAYCNMMYMDCRNNCTGCYTTEESRELCIGSAGNAYYF